MFASTAARFGAASEQPGQWYAGATDRLSVLAVPGGLPLHDGDRLIGGIGIGGTDPATCADRAKAVVRP